MLQNNIFNEIRLTKIKSIKNKLFFSSFVVDKIMIQDCKDITNIYLNKSTLMFLNLNNLPNLKSIDCSFCPNLEIILNNNLKQIIMDDNIKQKIILDCRNTINKKGYTIYTNNPNNVEFKEYDFENVEMKSL